MKHTKKKTIPARKAHEVEVFSHTTCDLCNKEIRDEGVYNHDIVTISRKVGVNYPDSGSETEVYFDVCGDCFASKVIPALESLGGVVYKEERDW